MTFLDSKRARLWQARAELAERRLARALDVIRSGDATAAAELAAELEAERARDGMIADPHEALERAQAERGPA